MEDGPPIFGQNFSCSALLVINLIKISLTGLSPSTVNLSRLFCYPYKVFRANPRSLATTYGISIDFFSYGYLDVSVPHVRSAYAVTGLQPAGLPHSEIFGYNVYVPLPEAYRSLSRPSSPLKA